MCFYTGLASLPLAKRQRLSFVPSFRDILFLVFSWRTVWRTALDRCFGRAGGYGLRRSALYRRPAARLTSGRWPPPFCYAGFNTATRYLRKTESAAMLAAMAQVSFILVSHWANVRAWSVFRAIGSGS